MLGSVEYAEKYFPGVDEITKLRVSIAYMDGAIAKAKEITEKLREDNSGVEEPDYDAIKHEYADFGDKGDRK